MYVCMYVYVRCSGCELLVHNLEEQVLKANLRRDKQIQLNMQIEQEVSRTLWNSGGQITVNKLASAWSVPRVTGKAVSKTSIYIAHQRRKNSP